MKLRTLAISLVFHIFWAPGLHAAAPHLAGVINLEKVLAGKQSATVDAGGGVRLALTAVAGLV